MKLTATVVSERKSSARSHDFERQVHYSFLHVLKSKEKYFKFRNFAPTTFVLSFCFDIMIAARTGYEI